MPDHERTRVTRRRLVQGLGLVGATTLAGCNRLDGGPEPGTSTTGGTTETASTSTVEPSGTLTVGLPDRPAGYAPATLTVGRGRYLRPNVYQGLYTYDEATELVPQLAGGGPEIGDDGRTYRVRLADGVRFHDGSPVAASDVKRSFDALAERGAGGGLAPLDSVTATDERTVSFSLAEPYAPFGHVLAAAAITPGGAAPPTAGAARTTGTGSSTGATPTTVAEELPPGSGPFRIAGSDRRGVRLERWGDYPGSPKAALEGAAFVRVPGATDRLNNLRSGENDVIEERDPTIWDQITSSGEAELVGTPGLDYVYLGFNCREGPTANPTVREAVDYCVSFDDAVEKFVEPTGTRLYSPLPLPVAEAWEMPTEEWAGIPNERNVEEATELLDGVDVVPDDWRPRIVAPDTRTYERLAIAVANGLGAAGYEPTIERLGPEAFANAHVSGNADAYDLFLSEWTGIPDPDAFTHPLFAPDAEGSTNGTFYRNDTVERKLATARQADDRQTRARLYRESITTVLEDRVHLPIHTRKRGFGVRDYVSGFDAHPVFGLRLVGGSDAVSMERQ